MPSKSKKQQRFFGLVHAYQQGKVKNTSEDVKRVAASISESDAEHFAKTKHGGIPEKAAETQEELAARWEAQRAAGLHNPVIQAEIAAKANSSQGGEQKTNVLDRVLGWFKREPTQEELRARFYEQNPGVEPDVPVESASGTSQMQQKASEWIKMFKQAGGTGHEAFLAAERAQKDENSKHKAGIDHLWSGAVNNFFLTPSYNAKHWRVPGTFAGAVGDVGKESLDNPEVWDRVKDLYFDPEYFSIPDMALTPHGSNVLQRVAKDPVNWGKVDAVTGKAIGAGLPEEPERHAANSDESVEKDSQFKEVDPYRRYNIGTRAKKVKADFLESEDSDKEFEKKKKEVDKKVEEDKGTLRVGADTLARALNTISDFMGDLDK